ncbi:MAG TPA: PrsW family glutamic-type intramembrane protease [Streptosporangiaceae bacterium]|jgi:RsiW-degrading membrane proteinase PrsW (M82 family)
MTLIMRGAAARAGRRAWLRILLTGLVLWAACAAVIVTTRNVNLVPTLILLGSFVVPVSYVAWAFGHWADEHVTAGLIVRAFVIGGLLGVFGASVLETYLLHPSYLMFFGVGLIEEGVKGAALLYIARRLPRLHARDGVVLGAAVGAGFAAFESMGYAFTSMITVHGLSVRALVETELLRGVLAPFGHGLWTAILGGVLFGASREGVFRYTRAVLGTYLWVSVLHGLWDSAQQVAVVITYLLTGTAWQLRLLTYGYLPAPTPGQVHLFTVMSTVILIVVALLGVLSLSIIWRRNPDMRATGQSPLRRAPAGPGWAG